MKIGILAYHSACNFGATLQLLSTYSYLKNNGHDPLVINWVPEDLEDFYRKPTPEAQYQMQKELRLRIWKETELCRNSEDVAHVIEKNGIQAVIVGSDAVAQHHAFPENIVFPTRKFISIRKYTQDRLYPNPFWAEFEKYLQKPIPVAYLSASSQDSVFKNYSKRLRSEMAESLSLYSWISVRDSWTQEMFRYITNGRIIPPVTPDPVFAFNYNAGSLLPSEKEVHEKFGLPDKYYLFSFERKRGLTQKWIDKFVKEANKRGIECVGLPFSIGATDGKFPIMIDFPLTPLEWYAIIKYSCGYIGNNMHPIVVSLHNANPFFSFDNYGSSKFKKLITSDKSSKIKHILGVSGFDDYRESCLHRNYQLPSPFSIIDKLDNFDRAKAKSFSDRYYNAYKTNMINILKSFER